MMMSSYKTLSIGLDTKRLGFLAHALRVSKSLSKKSVVTHFEIEGCGKRDRQIFSYR